MKHPDMPWAYIMERVPTVPEPVGNRMGYAVLGENERAYCEKVLINDYQGGKDMLAKFYDAAGEHLPPGVQVHGGTRIQAHGPALLEKHHKTTGREQL